MFLDSEIIGSNFKLKKVLEEIESNEEIKRLWECQNVNSIDRLKINDHGPMHVKIVAKNALKLLRILRKFNIVSSVEKDYKMSWEDSEVIVVLAALFHDSGLIVNRDKHEIFSVVISLKYLDLILDKIYNKIDGIVIKSEILNALYTHSRDMKPITLEGAIIKLADGLDMEKGRARIPFKLGAINIHSVSALAIEKVEIFEGNKDKPIIIRVIMRNSAGIFQITELLKDKIKGTPIENYVKVVAEITGDNETRIIDKFEI